MPKRIGIMGGTFDPVHCGHLLVAEQAREQLNLDEVWFMPAGIPPHKKREGISHATDRMAMLQLAIADHPSFRVTDVELRREGPSYTVDTMSILTRQNPDAQFFFLVGADMIDILPKWHRFEELAVMVTFVGVARPGFGEGKPTWNGTVRYIDSPAWEISSTLIRERAKAGRSLRYLVPPTVERYIKEKRIYESSHQSGGTASESKGPDE